jgi:hypothetical protein
LLKPKTPKNFDLLGFPHKQSHSLTMNSLWKIFKVQLFYLLWVLMSLEKQGFFNSSINLAVQAFWGSLSDGGKKVALPPFAFQFRSLKKSAQ